MRWETHVSSSSLISIPFHGSIAVKDFKSVQSFSYKASKIHLGLGLGGQPSRKMELHKCGTVLPPMPLSFDIEQG